MSDRYIYIRCIDLCMKTDILLENSHRTVAAPVYVAENLLKKRKTNEKNAAIKARERIQLRKVFLIEAKIS